jgi:hypothetical protein
VPTLEESLREALDLALARLAKFPDGPAKALLVTQAAALGKELDAANSDEAKAGLQRKIALLHAVLAKAGPPRRAAARRTTM